MDYIKNRLKVFFLPVNEEQSVPVVKNTLPLSIIY